MDLSLVDTNGWTDEQIAYYENIMYGQWDASVRQSLKDHLRIQYMECAEDGCDFKGVRIWGLDDPNAPDIDRHIEETGHFDHWIGVDRSIDTSLLAPYLPNGS